jgi:hypothetical protein
MVLAQLASRDMTLRMVHVYSALSTMLSHLTVDVANGTGITKFAFNAPTDGPSMPTKSALP